MWNLYPDRNCILMPQSSLSPGKWNFYIFWIEFSFICTISQIYTIAKFDYISQLKDVK